jgi:hypothetical protein
MPRAPAKKIAGERARDERRTSGGPKLHGRQWHDHETAKDFQPASKAGSSAIPEVEGGGEHIGMRRQAGARHKRMTPVGKGIKGIKSRKPGAVKKSSRAGAKRTSRAGKSG